MFSKSNENLYNELKKRKKDNNLITASDIDEMTRNTSDENMSMLLDYYEEKTGKDFFSDTNEEFTKKENIEEEINKAEIEETDSKVAGENDLVVDQKVKEKIEKEEEEKKRPLTENERLAILLKAQFLANLERYTSNVLKAQNAQIARNSFAMEDKINTRVVLERAYGDSRAVAYQNVTGKSLMEDPEVKEAVKDCESKLITGNKVINQNMEKDIARVNELEERIRYIKDKISELSAKANQKDNNEFELEMENLSKELNDAELELRGLTPDAVDLERDLEIENRNNEFEDRRDLGYYNSTVPHHELAEKDAREMKDGYSNKDEMVEEFEEKNIEDSKTEIYYTSETLDNIEKLIDNATNMGDIENIYLALQQIDNSISIDEFEDIQKDTGVKASNEEVKSDRQENDMQSEKEFSDEVGASAQDRRVVAAKDCLREHVNELRGRLNIQKGQTKEQELSSKSRSMY